MGRREATCGSLSGHLGQDERLGRLPGERIDVLVHPQSIVHSMVEYIDGCVLAQLGVLQGLDAEKAVFQPDVAVVDEQVMDAVKRAFVEDRRQQHNENKNKEMR